MKRIITIISALLLVLILSQCKKKPVVTDNGPEPISITLNVAGGSKVDVNTGTGEVTFEEGDVIYVASDGKYVGYLTYQFDAVTDVYCFKGSIKNAVVDEPLYFYFLGNKTPYETLTNGTLTNGITSLSVDIIDQTSGKLPVISAAASTEDFDGTSGPYTATLLNKCALVKFNVTTASNDAATCIKGLNNKVSITFDSENIGTINYERVRDASICLAAGNGVRWAVLLPQENVGAGSDCLAYSYDISYIGTYDYVGNVNENDYINSGSGIDVNISTAYESKISQAFSVSGTNRVYFSRGNLQYIGSADIPYWRFAVNQFDVLGVNGQGSADANADRDLFGWGCTGHYDMQYHNHQTEYLPNSVGITNTNYGPSFDVDNDETRFLSSERLSDWGCNAIINGVIGVGESWRSMTSDEWDYLLFTRITNSGVRFIKAQVNYVFGLVLLPDSWNAGYYPLYYYNDVAAQFKQTKISKEEWNANFEPNGAVFLPCAGLRTRGGGVSQSITLQNIGGEGYYWTKECGNENNGKSLHFANKGQGEVPAMQIGTSSRYGGFSVRLVCDVE